jgi:hypothetical protein
MEMIQEANENNVEVLDLEIEEVTECIAASLQADQ